MSSNPASFIRRRIRVKISSEDPFDNASPDPSGVDSGARLVKCCEDVDGLAPAVPRSEPILLICGLLVPLFDEPSGRLGTSDVASPFCSVGNGVGRGLWPARVLSEVKIDELDVRREGRDDTLPPLESSADIPPNSYFQVSQDHQ